MGVRKTGSNSAIGDQNIGFELSALIKVRTDRGNNCLNSLFLSLSTLRAKCGY